MSDRVEYPLGVDCVWIGLDKTGSVAAFVTAGSGDIPRSTLFEGKVDLLDTEEFLMRLSVLGKGTVLVAVPRPDDFLDLSHRGLYVYDWGKTGYTLAAVPGKSIVEGDLPENLRQLAALARFDDVTFRTSGQFSFAHCCPVVTPIDGDE